MSDRPDLRARCALSDDAFEARRRDLRATLLPRVRRSERLRDGAAFELPATPGNAAALADFVAYERACCGGLDFRVVEVGDALRLEVRGVDAGAVLAALGAPSASEA